MTDPPVPFHADTSLPCEVCASPNHGDRRGRAIDSIILHYTGMATAQAALSRLCDPAAEVSSHYLVDETGAIVQLVREDRRAWHAGRSYWQGERDLNSVSIGIEIANAGHDGGVPPYPTAQIDAVIALCRDIVARRNIEATRVLGHSDIAPGRKIDPGEHFPWSELAIHGLGRWASAEDVHETDVQLAIGAVGARVADLQANLRQWGMDIEASGTFDPSCRAAVRAFQQHYRPQRCDGVADAQTRSLMRALLQPEPRGRDA